MGYRSVVEWCGTPLEEGGSRCGYCKSPNTCYTNDGMWAHVMSPSDYQDLIDRGWRRSGLYCYKPNMKKTCCPMYTIRLEVNKYRASRTQKRTIRNLNSFLNGKHSSSSNESVVVDRTKPVTLQQTPSSKIQESKIQTVFPFETVLEPDVNLNELKSEIKSGSIPKRHSSSKKRQQRIERRIAKGKPFKRGPPPGEQEPKNVQTRLGEDIQIIHKSQTEFTLKGNENELCIKLVKIGSALDTATEEESFQVYKKYQVDIHKDKPEETSIKSWTRFLRRNPFREEESSFLGLYHCHYRLNGRLICVGVLDYLPDCLSSVYLYYDTEFSFLNLGTYSAVMEIYLSKLVKKPFYYMGYYIHSCQKMKYKGRFHPSYLACPETYNWFPTTTCLPILDNQSYARFDIDPDSQDPNRLGFDISKLSEKRSNLILPSILTDGTAFRWNQYLAQRPDFAPLDSEEAAEIFNYSTLIGKRLALKMLLYRPM